MRAPHSLDPLGEPVVSLPYGSEDREGCLANPLRTWQNSLMLVVSLHRASAVPATESRPAGLPRKRESCRHESEVPVTSVRRTK
jgi:hypothetical protein